MNKCPKCESNNCIDYGGGLQECRSCGFIIDEVFDVLVDEDEINPMWFDESDFNDIWE